jgi:hypothetical protein
MHSTLKEGSATYIVDNHSLLNIVQGEQAAVLSIRLVAVEVKRLTTMSRVVKEVPGFDNKGVMSGVSPRMIRTGIEC